MTPEEMTNLSSGDIIRHASGGEAFVVTGNFGGRVTAVRTVDVTNPIEWELVKPRVVTVIHHESERSEDRAYWREPGYGEMGQ